MIARNARLLSALAAGLLSAATSAQQSTPEEFAGILRRDFEKWLKVIKSAGIRID